MGAGGQFPRQKELAAGPAKREHLGMLLVIRLDLLVVHRGFVLQDLRRQQALVGLEVLRPLAFGLYAKRDQHRWGR